MKTYYKYEKVEPCIGLISSCNSNIISVPKLKIASLNREFLNCVACGALEDIVFWSFKENEKIYTLSGEKSQVTRIAYQNYMVAGGYMDGCVRVWNINENEPAILFKAHTSSITSLEFNHTCTLLASGSVDSSLVIWDIVNECGKYKFNGHKGAITHCYFMCTIDVLISSSKDTFIKLWDLESQHCFATLLGHDSEISDFQLLDNETTLITAGSSNDLKIWQFELNLPDNHRKRSASKSMEIPLKCQLVGSILKPQAGHSKMIQISDTQKILAVLNQKGAIDIFRIKKPKSTNDNFLMSQRFRFLYTIVIENLDKAHFYFNDSTKKIYLTTLLKNNTLESYLVDKKEKKDKNSLISHFGHRSPPLSVVFNSNSTYLCSASKSEIKLWNVGDKNCIRTISAENTIVLSYLFGDRFIVAGTKTGTVNVYNVSNGLLVESVTAHGSKIWDIKHHPTLSCFATGSSDKEVKFWSYEAKASRVMLSHQRSLEMEEDVISLVYSPNGKFLAVSLIDCTVKVFFEDTLKYYLTLYGHKLPVYHIDISTDNQLVITGSGDKNIKIWGLDFGDIHKSIFAHNSTINRVKFVPGTHDFFSCSNDGLVKYWDGESFKLIQSLEGHHNKVNDLCISGDGSVLASISNDFSIRIWQRTEELFVPEIEDQQDHEDVKQRVLVNEAEKEAVVPLQSTSKSLQCVENLIEALDILESEEKKDDDTQTHPILLNFDVNAEQYVLNVLTDIPLAYLDITFTTLPFKYVLKFLNLIPMWLECGLHVELCTKCHLFLLKLHFYQLINTPNIQKLLERLSVCSNKQLSLLEEEVGVNFAWMNHLKHSIESEKNSSIFSNIKTNKKK